MLSYFQEKIKNKQTLISFIIVIIILAFLLFNVNLSELIKHISQINPVYYILGIIVFYLSILPRAIRYNILLRNIGINQKIKEITEIYFLSWFANLIAPAKLGDLYRSYLIKKNYGNSKSETLGATFVERLMDLILLIILISVAGFLLIEETISGQIKNFLIIAYLILIVLIISIFILKGFRAKLTKLLPERFQHIVPNFENSMSTCLTKKTIIPIFFLTIIYWALEIGTLYLVALALNINLSLMLIIFITLIAALASVIPLTPSGAGTAEAGVTATLVLFGTPYGLALAIAIVHRSIDYYSGLITGAIVYFKSKLK